MALLVLLLAVLGACRPAADDSSAARPIFRHFNTELSTIRLGQSWTAEEVPGAEPKDTVVALPSGSFENAQAVRVHRTADGVVSSIVFDYPETAGFQALEAEYRQLLGEPEERETPARAGAAERVVWEDSLTRFELVHDPKRSASAVYTRLSDLSGSR